MVFPLLERQVKVALGQKSKATFRVIIQRKLFLVLLELLLSQAESNKHAGGCCAASQYILSSGHDLEAELLQPVLSVVSHESDLVNKQRVFGSLQLEHED